MTKKNKILCDKNWRIKKIERVNELLNESIERQKSQIHKLTQAILLAIDAEDNIDFSNGLIHGLLHDMEKEAKLFNNW